MEHQLNTVNEESLMVGLNIHKGKAKSMINIAIKIIIIIIIAFKGAIRDLSQYPHCAANRLQHVRSSGPCTIVCKSHATHRSLIIIIINLIYIAQFDTNGILTALYIVITYIQMQYVHLCTYAEQSYKYTYTCLHIHTYTVTCTNIHLPTY